MWSYKKGYIRFSKAPYANANSNYINMLRKHTAYLTCRGLVFQGSHSSVLKFLKSFFASQKIFMSERFFRSHTRARSNLNFYGVIMVSIMHRFYIYSNLNTFVPKVKLTCPTSVILAGNFGCIKEQNTWNKVAEIKRAGFTNIFWVPYLTEFSSAKTGRDIYDLGWRFDESCRELGIIPMNNQVGTFMGMKMIGSPMFTTKSNMYYASEDRDFVYSEVTTDSLVMVGSICPTPKAKYIIHGTPPTGENFCVASSDQMHIANSRDAVGFNENFYVDINFCNCGHRRCLNGINCSSWRQRDLE